MLDFEITTHLYNVATYYLLHDERHRAKSFERAAMVLDGFGHFIKENLDHGNLMNLSGIGRSTFQAVTEIIETGKYAVEDTLASTYAPFLAELGRVPHFGPRLLKKISETNCSSIYDLEKNLEQNKIKLPTAAATLFKKYIHQSNPDSNNFIGIPLPIALSISSELCANIESFELILVGEARMKCERVRILHFLTSNPDLKILAKKMKAHRFCLQKPEVLEDSIHTLIFPGIHCIIQYCHDSLKSFFLLKLSSPENHLQELTECSKTHDYQWQDNGIFSGTKNVVQDCLSEQEIYSLIGTVYVPPEIRHMSLQTSTQLADKLLDKKMIKGDFHTHTTWSDGIDDLRTILQRANGLGYEYLAITDHSQSLKIANGISIGEALKQHDEIDKINATKNRPQLLKGIEVEILSDGSLDYPTEILSEFDLVVAAVHMNTRMDASSMTQRILRAIRNPNVHILAHPTGSMTSRPGNFFATRDAFDLNFDLIAQECAKQHVALEINAFPERLDLSSTYVQKVLNCGAKIAIGSDAHSAYHLALLDSGIHVAQRAGCTDKDVLNTYPWAEAKKYLYSKPLQEVSYEAKRKHRSSKKTKISTSRQNIRTLFNDLVEQQKTVVGIDLTASEDRASGWAILRAENAHTQRLSSDNDLIEATKHEAPDLVSIDSPLSLPYGRCCTKPDCKCRKYGITRFCERFLMSMGIGVFPCLIPSMVQLTMRGIRLAKMFEEQGIPVIESYPGAAQDLLGIPRKQRGEDLLYKSLKLFGINMSDSNISHDELDAVTSALVGYFYLSGQYLGLGDERENELIVPSIPAFEISANENNVIALTGATGTGKTTAAIYLALRYGFKYIRYSQVIARIANLTGKYDKKILQEAGWQLHKEMGQQEITRNLIESLPENSHVVIDGMRFVDDLQTLQKHFGKRLKPVMIESPKKVIIQRLKKIPFYLGKSQKDLEGFLNHEVESDIFALSFNILEKIKNNGSFKSYHEKLDALIRSI